MSTYAVGRGGQPNRRGSLPQARHDTWVAGRSSESAQGKTTCNCTARKLERLEDVYARSPLGDLGSTPNGIVIPASAAFLAASEGDFFHDHHSKRGQADLTLIENWLCASGRVARLGGSTWQSLTGVVP